MWIRVLTCEALARPVYASAANSPHIVDVELLQRGLHDRPVNLRKLLQEKIDETDQRYDAVALAYGLCGKATAGLVARKTRLILPKAHDCITLFLGSRNRYNQEFESNPGTYWYAQDYIERNDGSGSSLSMGTASSDDINAEYEKYVKKYGKDNADYLMEVMGAWKNHYNRAVYIDMGLTTKDDVESKAKSEAARRGWTFERLTGDDSIIRRLVHGDWDNDFLVLEPGQKIHASNNDQVIDAE